MTLARQVKIQLSVQQSAAAARWLPTYRPFPPSLVGNPERRRKAQKNAATLSARFAKIARRKIHGDSAVRKLPRHLAEWFGQLLDACVISAYQAASHLPPPLVIEAMRACKKATSGKRGRPRLVGTRAELAARQLADDNERRRRQLRRRARYESAFEDWFSHLTARGETLITSSEPPPKI